MPSALEMAGKPSLMAAVAEVAKGELCDFGKSGSGDSASDASIASANDRARCKQKTAVRRQWRLWRGLQLQHSRHSELASPAANAKLSRGLNAAKNETMLGTGLQERTAESVTTYSSASLEVHVT